MKRRKLSSSRPSRKAAALYVCFLATAAFCTGFGIYGTGALSSPCGPGIPGLKDLFPDGKAVLTESENNDSVTRFNASHTAGRVRNFANSFGYTAKGSASRPPFGNRRWKSAISVGSENPGSIGLGASSSDASLFRREFECEEADSSLKIEREAAICTVAKLTETLEGWPDAFAHVLRCLPAERSDFSTEKRGFSKCPGGDSGLIRRAKLAKGHTNHGHLGFDLADKNQKEDLLYRRSWYVLTSEMILKRFTRVCANK